MSNYHETNIAKIHDLPTNGWKNGWTCAARIIRTEMQDKFNIGRKYVRFDGTSYWVEWHERWEAVSERGY